MSTSISALSGMTLSFTPACAMFGENVVRVAAYIIRSVPAGMRSSAASNVAGVVSAIRCTAGRSMLSMKRFQRSCRWSGALYLAMRVMSSDAFTSALSDL